MTSACETTVKSNEWTRAARKDGVWSAPAKFARPTNRVVSLPTRASLTER